MAVRLTEVEKEHIRRLRATGMAVDDIARAVGRSISATNNYVSIMEQASQIAPSRIGANKTNPPDLPPAPDDPSAFDKYKLQLAAKSLNTAAVLVQSIDDMSAIELRKTPLSQRAIAAGILMDKFKQLTTPDPQSIVDQVASIVSLIAKATPTRAKDAPPEDAQLAHVPVIEAALPDPNADPDPEDEWNG